MGIFSRGKKQAEPVKRPRAAKKERPGGGALSLWLEVAVFLLFAFLLYTLASLFSLRTGAWGERIRFSLLQNMGGAILIPVLFCIYLCVAFFLKSGTANFFKQLLGSFLLFLCTALLLGLFRMARLFSASGVLSPGYLGDGLAIFFTRNIGTFGTFLLGLATLVLTATLYGLLQPASIAAKGAAFVKTLGSVRRLRPRSGREDAGDGPLPTPSPSALREDAPSLSRSRELTFSDEEQGGEFPMIPADERETPRQEPSAPEEDLPVDVAPEDGPAPDEPEGDPSAVPEIQFNEEEGSEKKVRGGTFPPPPDLFGPRQQEDSAEQNDAVREQGNAIIGTLSDFGIQAELADVIIVDTGAGLSESVISFIMAADEVLLVTTPEPTSITDAYALMKMVSNRDKSKKIRVVVNRAENAGEARNVMDKLKLVAEKFLGIEIEATGYVLQDDMVVKAVKQQEPFITGFPRSPAARNIKEISQKLVESGENTGFRESSGIKVFLNKLVGFIKV